MYKNNLLSLAVHVQPDITCNTGQSQAFCSRSQADWETQLSENGLEMRL